MTTKTSAASTIDMEKYRLRSFVERLIDMGEVEIHDQLVPLAGLGAVIEGTQKAVLFKKTGPEQAEMVAKTAGNRSRLAAAFQTSEDKLYEEYFKRLANPQTVLEMPSKDAPVHELAITGNNVDLTKLPFNPQHAYDGSCYMSSAIDYADDPLTGRRNVGCRRLTCATGMKPGPMRQRPPTSSASIRLALLAANGLRSRLQSARIRSISSQQPHAREETSCH